MKELSIEEKAKRYDEAIERAESLLSGNQLGNAWIYKLLPKLEESEDEKIRKHIIEVFRDNFSGKDTDKCIAWLEKQGQTFTKKDIDDAYLKGVTDTKNEIEKQYEASYQIRKDIATFIFNYKDDIKDRAKWMDYLGIKVSFTEKQGEQKPTEWSEEDEDKMQIIINIIKDSDPDWEELINWLKSLKERYTWKPSDEQIKVCKEVYADLLSAKGFDIGTVNSELNRLEEALKKLREE